MSKRRNTRHVRADTKQAPATTMDAFSNPIARLGYGTQDLLQATQYPLTLSLIHIWSWCSTTSAMIMTG